MLNRAQVVAVTIMAAALAAAPAVLAGKKTVCTITVNSSDEKESFQRNLPRDGYEFVELVEHGRPDWLASACTRQVSCDILVISGHYDGGKEFFPDSLDKSEFLPVDEMERVACSDSCPGLFSKLKEVYLFGCNTLNPEAQKSVASEVGRSLLRAGHSRSDVDRLTRAMSSRHGESSRDRMRLIFKDVPAIYGFSSTAPLGPTAGSILDRHFRSSGVGEVGSGRASTRLLAQFAGKSMVVTSGMADADPQSAHRRDVCQFADDRLSPSQKLDFLHALMGREMGDVRMFIDRVEKLTVAPDDPGDIPGFETALQAIAHDDVAKDRFLALARDADQLATRARMFDIARNIGWLSADEKQAELARMIEERANRDAIGAAEVDLVCELNREHRLDGLAEKVRWRPEQSDLAGPAAVQACLGDEDAHRRVLRALTSGEERDMQVAQVYLRHRPVGDVEELRELTAGIARMGTPSGQVRALDALASLRLADPESLEALARLFPLAESESVQTAIAGVFIRSDYKAIDRLELAQTLRQHRIGPRAGENLIDVLIRRLQSN